ncbi:MAG: SpoIVB peptidase S55 domain-containing protein [Halanaerobium sp.]
MSKKIKKVLFCILIVLILINTPVLAAENIMPLDEVEAGMTGYGKTVFSGSKIEEFEIEVVDVMDNRSLEEDLILIKLTGDKTEDFGGIASGMSGSPIYIEDQLIGAIGYGWNNSDHRFGLVTPIERMLKLLDNNEIEKRSGNISDLEFDLDEFSPGKNIIRSSSPIMVSGIKGRALERLEDNLSELNLDVVPSPGIKEADKSDREPEPGEAVAVQLVRGDISVASIGTLTYVDQGNFLAFGHPFTNRGEVNYLLSRADINAVIPNSEQPFKLGSPYNRLLGSVNQDRGAGIAGRIGSFPRITPVYISISENGKLLKEVSLQIINDEFLFTSLSNSAALQAVDSALDRIGPGSAESKLKIMGRGLPELQIESTNMYYSQNDIGSTALYDFSQLLDLILTNPFKEVNLIDIRLELDFNKNDSVALIQEAKVLNEEIYPGDELEVEVTLHRYRNGTETKTLKMELPEDIEPGIATLFVDGGYTGETMRPEENNQMQSSGGLNEAEISGHKSFESMLDSYLDSPDNNDLILQLYPSYAAPTYQESSESPPNKNQQETENKGEEMNTAGQNREAAEELEEEIKERFATDYVLEGSLNLDIEILESPEDSAEEEASENEASAEAAAESGAENEDENKNEQ